MIYHWTCDRRRFVDLIASRRPLTEDEATASETLRGLSVRGDDVVLVWDKSPTHTFALPRATIIAEGATSDFLAWVSTYFRQIRPFTAHCRILTPSLIELISQVGSFPKNPDVGSADIGLILAEGIAYSVGRTDLSKLSFSAFARTLSFALAQGMRRYGSSFSECGAVFDQIKNGWLSSRELSSQSPLNLSVSEISEVWAVILNAIDGINRNTSKPDPLLVEAISGLRSTGLVSKDVWKQLASPFLKVDLLGEVLEGPREGRVKAVESAIRDLLRGPKESRKHRAFIAGFLASRVQPGSFDHLPLLFPSAGELRESLLWYGVCSGITRETAVDSYGNGLGWLMRRELSRPSHWLDRPYCDIALGEMALLLGNQKSTRPILPTLASGVLSVEVFPLISSSVKWTDHGDDHDFDKASSGQQRGLFEDDGLVRRDVLELLRKIEETSMSLDAIRKQVEATLGDKGGKGRNRKK